MGLSRLMPMMMIGGIGYANQEEVEEIAKVPIDIVKVAVTQAELATIRRFIIADVVSGASPRGIQRKFKSYLQKNMSSPYRDPSVDFWGTDYKMGPVKQDWELWSCGPDLKSMTDDDVYITIEGKQLDGWH